MTTERTGGLGPDDSGSAVVVVLLAVLLVTALGVGLLTLGGAETMIVANFTSGTEAIYAADGLAERVVQDLRLVPRWSDALSGVVTSPFIDAAGRPETPFGEMLDLVAMTGDLQSETDAGDRWGLNNPRWRLFASGSLSALASGTIESPVYVVAWVADDPSETDNDPATDSNGVVIVRAQALGAFGTRRMVELTVARVDPRDAGRAGVRVLAWREIR